MRIAILTLPLHTNYGGILQAFALQTVLERMGHEVVVVDLDQTLRRGAWVQTKEWAKYAVKRYLLRREAFFMSDRQRNLEREEREQHTRAFVRRHIHTCMVRNLTRDFPLDVDAIVVGSDQVWRKPYFCDMYGCGIENAFLAFTEGRDMKRIAYAASFGTDDWEYDEEEMARCRKALARFDAVGVREASAVDLCARQLGRNDACHVLDPTMLLTKEDYVGLLRGERLEVIGERDERLEVIGERDERLEVIGERGERGKMMCYILDNSSDKQQLVERLARERGLTPFYANSKTEDFKASRQERIQPPVEQWLRGFMDAELVVTDSFHACVFAIIFGKPYIAVGNKERGMARFASLEEAKRNLEAWRQSSLEFLSEAVEGRRGPAV